MYAFNVIVCLETSMVLRGFRKTVPLKCQVTSAKHGILLGFLNAVAIKVPSCLVHPCASATGLLECSHLVAGAVLGIIFWGGCR